MAPTLEVIFRAMDFSSTNFAEMFAYPLSINFISKLQIRTWIPPLKMANIHALVNSAPFTVVTRFFVSKR